MRLRDSINNRMGYTLQEQKLIKEYEEEAIKKIYELRFLKSNEYKNWRNKLDILYNEFSEIVDKQLNTNNKLIYDNCHNSQLKKLVEINTHLEKQPKQKNQ